MNSNISKKIDYFFYTTKSFLSFSFFLNLGIRFIKLNLYIKECFYFFKKIIEFFESFDYIITTFFKLKQHFYKVYKLNIRKKILYYKKTIGKIRKYYNLITNFIFCYQRFFIPSYSWTKNTIFLVKYKLRSKYSYILKNFYLNPLSKFFIPIFIKIFKVNMSNYLEESYDCFNSFFIRKLKEPRRIETCSKYNKINQTKFIEAPILCNQESQNIENQKLNTTIDPLCNCLVSPIDGKAIAIEKIGNSKFLIQNEKFCLSELIEQNACEFECLCEFQNNKKGLNNNEINEYDKYNLHVNNRIWFSSFAPYSTNFNPQNSKQVGIDNLQNPQRKVPFYNNKNIQNRNRRYRKKFINKTNFKPVNSDKLDLPIGIDKENRGLLIFKLGLENYHHFHAPISGKIESVMFYNGSKLVNTHSVMANTTFSRNFKAVIKINTINNSTLWMIIIGTNMVGSIIVNVNQGDFIEKGNNMGYLQLGASSIVLLFDKNYWDLKNKTNLSTNLQAETAVFMGRIICNNRS